MVQLRHCVHTGLLSKWSSLMWSSPCGWPLWSRELDNADIFWVSCTDVASVGMLDSRAWSCFLKASTSLACRSLWSLKSCEPLNRRVLQYMVLSFDEVVGVFGTMQYYHSVSVPSLLQGVESVFSTSPSSSAFSVMWFLGEAPLNSFEVRYQCWVTTVEHQRSVQDQHNFLIPCSESSQNPSRHSPACCHHLNNVCMKRGIIVHPDTQIMYYV